MSRMMAGCTGIVIPNDCVGGSAVGGLRCVGWGGAFAGAWRWGQGRLRWWFASVRLCGGVGRFLVGEMVVRGRRVGFFRRGARRAALEAGRCTVVVRRAFCIGFSWERLFVVARGACRCEGAA